MVMKNASKTTRLKGQGEMGVLLVSSDPTADAKNVTQPKKAIPIAKKTFTPPKSASNDSTSLTVPYTEVSTTTSKAAVTDDNDLLDFVEHVIEGDELLKNMSVSSNETFEVDGENVPGNAQMEQDDHKYYQSMIYSPGTGQHLWVDFEKAENATVHDLLSDSHRRAAAIQLPFDFPFYGHMIRNVTLATGGFIYMGTFIHSWIAATQYIAPLMGNFATNYSNDSTIKYLSNETSFTVQWENVVLADFLELGNFTFQATLKNNGDIIFAYRDLPINVTDIKSKAHPVKIGLADAYNIERRVFCLLKNPQGMICYKSFWLHVKEITKGFSDMPGPDLSEDMKIRLRTRRQRFIKRAVDNGIPAKDVTEAFGVSLSTVYHVMEAGDDQETRRKGRAPPNLKRTEEFMTEVAAAVAENQRKSHRQLAKEFDVSDITLRHTACDLDLKSYALPVRQLVTPRQRETQLARCCGPVMCHIIRRKTIYEYHRLELKDKQKTGQWSAIYLKALDTCPTFNDCNSCLTSLPANSTFTCYWCEQAGRCSDGVDRLRQDWLLNGCTRSSVGNVSQCPASTPQANTTIPISTTPTSLVTSSVALTSMDTSLPTPTRTAWPVSVRPTASIYTVSTTPVTVIDAGGPAMAKHMEETGIATSGVIGIFISLLVLSCALWVLYAYKFPHSPSGQLLIKYRPTQWRWSRTPRYTAASIHM
ncbi:unnamed protein product [Darwinula stevensoni]|uniref:Plexin domain-containing protein 2 n=1 Tax=Darwinula stevensoni TaxID=69355 RepID=A0A7R9ABQ4_9CRUS|nr:unnamed protein product [Darwinula stevensoni]CAG0899469.1 unnamed protein product [Darwinula stevensoni]